MKKSNLIQIVTILLVSAMVLLFSTTVNAANDNNEVHDLTGTLTKNSTSNNTNNSSVYNNTNLPKTGGVNSVILIFISAIILTTGTILFLKNNNLRKEIKK